MNSASSLKLGVGVLVWRGAELLLDTELMPTSFGTDDEGTIYLVDWGGSIQTLAPNL